MLQRVLLLASLAAAACIAGCGEKSTEPKPKPAPPVYLKQTSPENVLANLATAYHRREIAAFDSLFYDSLAAGDTTEGYRFHFWSRDLMDDPNLPPSWGREPEILSASAMFSAADIENVVVQSLTHAGAYADTAHAGQKIVYVTNASLDVVQMPEGQDVPTLWRVEANLARFRFKVQYVTAKGDSIWRIVSWEDLGVPGYRAKPGIKNQSWGMLKSMFAP